MVYLEGIGLVNEKPPIVLEIGRKYTRCGVAGEASPYGIIPTKSGLFMNEDSFHLARKQGDLQLALINFIQDDICSRTLLLSLKDRHVIVLESILGSSDYREAVAEVLFNHFEVAALLFCPSHSAALYPLGINTALVVDIGMKETVIVPVVQNYTVLKSWHVNSASTEKLYANLAMALKECKVLPTEGSSSSEAGKDLFSDKILEDIQVRCCFVTTRARKENSKENPETIQYPPQVYYPLDGNKTLVIEGKVRELSAEVLFDPDEDLATLASVMLQSIVECPIDTRKSLLENILVIGGTAAMTGFTQRLLEELRHTLSSVSHFKDSLGQLGCAPKFHVPACPSNYVSWLGGAIIGGTSLIQQKGTNRESYKRLGRVPEWCDLRDNPLCPPESKG